MLLTKFLENWPAVLEKKIFESIVAVLHTSDKIIIRKARQC